MRSYRDKKPLQKQENKRTITFGKYDFSHLVEPCYSEKSTSGEPIFKSILYIRNKDLARSLEVLGQPEPFLKDQVYIDYKTIKHEIGDIRLLLEYR